MSVSLILPAEGDSLAAGSPDTGLSNSSDAGGKGMLHCVTSDLRPECAISVGADLHIAASALGVSSAKQQWEVLQTC